MIQNPAGQKSDAGTESVLKAIRDGLANLQGGGSSTIVPAPPSPTPTVEIGNLIFVAQKSSGLVPGKLPGYWTCDFEGTISGWNITVDAGTITLRIWKIGTGGTHPTVADNINTAGISISSGTTIHSDNVGDFTNLIVNKHDIFAVEILTASGVYDLGGSVEITKT